MLRVAADAHRRYGPASMPHYVISKADSVSDILELAVLLKEVGLLRPREGAIDVDIVPLFETIDALRSGVPILPVFNFREGRFLMRTVVRRPFRVPKTSDRSADISASVHHLAAEIEWAIRQHPHQWFCFRKLWG
jgi:hypothetical protein